MADEENIFPTDYVMPAWVSKMGPLRVKTKIDVVVNHVNDVEEATQDSTCKALGYKVGMGKYLNEAVKLGYLTRTEGRPIIYRPVKVRPVHEVAGQDSGVIEPITLYLDGNKLSMLKALCAERFGSTYIGGQKTILGKLIDEEYHRLELKGVPIRGFLKTALVAEADFERLRQEGADAQSNSDRA